jgi:hypothetical protein
MAEFPALPLFTDAYLGDTTHLEHIRARRLPVAAHRLVALAWLLRCRR